MRNPSARAGVLERAVRGAVACVVASVPLAIGWSLWGFYVLRSDQDWPAVYVLFSILVVGAFAMTIAAASAFCVGVPVYALVSRLNGLRPLVLLLSAVVVAVVVHEAWHGGALFEDVPSALLFAFFGLYSGLAFWAGADLWQPGLRRRSKR
jgi:hypothetical protein